jgi:hypothetical protein
MHPVLPHFSRPLAACHSTNQGRRCAPLAFQTALRKACSLLPTTRVARPRSPTQSQATHFFVCLFFHPHFSPRVFPPPLPHGRGPLLRQRHTSCVHTRHICSSRTRVSALCAHSTCVFGEPPTCTCAIPENYLRVFNFRAQKLPCSPQRGAVSAVGAVGRCQSTWARFSRPCNNMFVFFCVCGRAVGVGHTECGTILS